MWLQIKLADSYQIVQCSALIFIDCITPYVQCQVWDTHHRKTSIAPGNERLKKSSLILEFKGHQYGVQCCAISPNEEVVISADIDSCIMVGGIYGHCTCRYIHVHVQCTICEIVYMYETCMYMYMCMYMYYSALFNKGQFHCYHLQLWEPLTGKILTRWRLSSPSPIVSPVMMETQPSFPPVYLPRYVHVYMLYT